MEKDVLTRKEFKAELTAEFSKFYADLVKILVVRFDAVDKRIDGCATKEQFVMLDNRISSIEGRVVDIQNNMAAFVVRDELAEHAFKQFKAKPFAGFAVREAGASYEEYDEDDGNEIL